MFSGNGLSWEAPAAQTPPDPPGGPPNGLSWGAPTPPGPTGEARTSRVGNGSNNRRDARRSVGALPKAAPVVLVIPGPAHPGPPKGVWGAGVHQERQSVGLLWISEEFAGFL